MSFRRLDSNARPIPSRSRRSPATKTSGRTTLYHYEIYYDLPPLNGKRRQRRRRAWLGSDVDAAALEQELRGNYSERTGFTWHQGWTQYREALEGKRAVSHLDNIGVDVRELLAIQGDQPIETTSLAAFSKFLDARARTSSPNRAAKARIHLLTLARWHRARGAIGAIPFEHVPVPEHTSRQRWACTIEEFYAIAKALPPSMAPLWRALGYTGSRITAMASIREPDIDGEYIHTVDKGRHLHGRSRRRIRITPPVAQVLDEARAWRATLDTTTDALFVNSRGNFWNHSSYKHALERVYAEHPKLPTITPHQLRHMFGTAAASLNLSPDLIQAGMGHDDRRSAEAYVDYSQAMADRVGQAVATFLQQLGPDLRDTECMGGVTGDTQRQLITCPCCGAKFCPDKEKGPKPL